jgi:two-component system response regulator CpxR
MNHDSIDIQCQFDRGVHVLLVDDEREFVQTLAERLQLRQMDTAVVYDGAAALQIIQQENPPQVMVIDLKMPGMDGMQVLQQVKQIQPCIQVIVLTGHGGEKDRDHCMAAGAFAYLQKPVDINQLSQLLKQASQHR